MASAFDRDTPSPVSEVVAPAPEARGARDAGDGDGSDAAQAQASADQDDASTTSILGEKTPKESIRKRQKVKRHCWRFKWWYLLGLIIFLAILLPILFEVIIPAIVQKIVNDQSLPINSGMFRAHSPDELIVSIDTSLDTPLGVDIDPVDLSLSRPGEDGEEHDPFIKLRLPGQHVDGKTEINVTNQTVTIDSQEELIAWFTQVFDKKEVLLGVRASPKVKLGTLDYKPSLKKTLEVPALNALEGFGVQDLRFDFGDDNSTSTSTSNLRGKVNLPNAGALALSLGNITFSVLSGDIKIGLLTVYDVVLLPGDNLRDFEGEIFFQELVPNLAGILDSQKAALAQGAIQLNATGNATIVNGQHIPYVEAVLKDKRIPFQIPIITLLVDVFNGLTSSEGSLMDVFGDVFGNSTLLEQALHHWDAGNNSEEGDGASLRSKLKRSAPKASLAWSIMNLGTRARK